MLFRFLVVLPLFLLGCAAPASKPATEKAQPPAPAAVVAQPCQCEPRETLPPLQIPDAERYAPAPVVVKPGEPPKAPEYGLLRPAEWSSVNGFEEDNLVASWPALLRSCGALKNREVWRHACTAASQLEAPDNNKIRTFLKEHFTPYQATNPDQTDTGLITGYYQPELNGSRMRTDRYRYPLYSRPDDLINVELGSLYPELASRRLRGKLTAHKLTPYYSRGEIDIIESPLVGKELLWVDDVVDLFFLQIQGSGIIKLESGENLPVGYADQNGHPYQSIGRVLIDRGELTPDKASMQGIKDWGRRNPDKLRELLNTNPSYVFFRELPAGLIGPLGALGVPITAERSIAVDPRYIPLGAPVFLDTTYPNSGQPLRRLMMAQDTGGAIKGAVRADFFWGAGYEPGRQAGAMKQRGKMWVLLPNEWAEIEK
jgi:membrane-bound lytic murein transglycosylase A